MKKVGDKSGIRDLLVVRTPNNDDDLIGVICEANKNTHFLYLKLITSLFYNFITNFEVLSKYVVAVTKLLLCTRAS